MTPFDPAALLAMLLAFYPVVGPAALARARLERPEYFAAATIVSTGQDKIQLPDGRVFDCIFDVGGPQQHWQMVEIHADGADDPFALEPGPLAPIDVSAFERAPYHPVFLPLVAGGLGELRGLDERLTTAASTIRTLPTPADLDAALGGPLDDAAVALWQQDTALDGLLPDDVIGATGAQGGGIDQRAAPYDEALPDEDDVPGINLPDKPAPKLPEA